MNDLGDVVQVAVAIRDSAGTLTSPATAVLTVTLPDLSTVTPVVSLPPAVTGIVRVDYPTTAAGLHRWRLVTTAPVTATSDAFNVVASSWPAFVGLDEVRAHLNIPATDTSHDEELRGLILSACAVVEDIVGVVAARTIVETASGGERHVVLERAPVISVTTVEADGEPVDAGDYTVSPSGLLARRSGRWPAGARNIEITYVPGRSVPPANLLDATLELIRINWRPQSGGNYGPFDGGQGDDFGVGAGSEAGLQGQLRLGFFVPNTVVQRLQPDRRPPVVL